MRPHFPGFSYVNYIDLDLENWPVAYYKGNLPRMLVLMLVLVRSSSVFAEHDQKSRTSTIKSNTIKGSLALYPIRLAPAPPFTFADHLAQVRDWTNLERATLHTRMFRH